MVVELKRQVSILEDHLSHASNIQGEEASLIALRDAMDITNVVKNKKEINTTETTNSSKTQEES